MRLMQGSKGVSATHKYGCTHGMHDGGRKVDRGAHVGKRGGGGCWFKKRVSLS